MRRLSPSVSGAISALFAVLFLVGGGPFSKDRKGVPDLSKEKPPATDETIRDLAYLRPDTIRVEGVGLVIGLNGTGSNPEPGAYRSKLLDRMRKANVEDAERWLESPTTSLVLVRGTIPAGVTSQDRWDVELELPPTSTTTSLEGGFLMMTPLTVVQLVEGQPMTGQEVASAVGPVLIPDTTKPKLGRVLGGAKSKKDLPYTLVLKEERQGYLNSNRIQGVINLRFHQRKGVDQVGMATAKTDQYLILNVPRVYHDNQFRYFQVIERLHVVENANLRSKRMAEWGRELLDPKTAGQAALKLEGVGRNSIAALKPGLESQNAQVRFFAAEALAYLNDPAGVDELANAARSRPEFRAFAFAALASMDDPAATLRLRELMNEPEPRVRYGAFRALKILDPHDPFLGQVRVLHDEPAAEEDADDAMALRLHSAPKRRGPRANDPFTLYLVECDGPPSVHVARSRHCEIVIFGRGQRLLTPVVLGGSGAFLVTAGLDAPQLEITRISAGDTEPMKVMSSCELGEVVRSLANLGASYPDVLDILETAERQKNLEGPLVVDSVASPSDAYEAAQLAGADLSQTAKKDGAVTRTGGEVEAPSEAPEARKGFLERLGLRRPRR